VPILAHEPDVFPDSLLDQAEIGRETDREWCVIHTKPRQEKEFVRRLLRLDIWWYLPQIARKFRSPSGRQRESFVPLFPSYAFVYGDAEQRLKALETGCSVHSLPVSDGVRLTHDLQQIWRLTQSGAPLTTEAHLEPGRVVRVNSGPFRGFEGRVFKRHSAARLLVIVNYLQQGVSVELDECDVEPM
jgi:transcriptional antiterminator RfaH